MQVNRHNKLDAAQKQIKRIYTRLYNTYGPQGWWPLCRSIDETGSAYVPDRPVPPDTREERFEILCGAVLTQNTAWNNAGTAVYNLYSRNLLTPQALLTASQDQIKELIRPAGYYNQKYRYLCEGARFFRNRHTCPERNELLSLRGFGRETADTILLYAYGVPVFIIDAYTRRIFAAAGCITGTEPYDILADLAAQAVPARTGIFSEYHALLVRHGKDYYRGRKRPHDPVLQDLL